MFNNIYTCLKRAVNAVCVVGLLGVCTFVASNQKVETSLVYEGVTAGSSVELTKSASNALQDASEMSLSKITDTVDVTGFALAYSISEADYTRYTTTALNVRAFPDEEANIIDTLSVGEAVTVVGEIENNKFVQINHNGTMSYVHSDYLSEEKPVAKKQVVSSNTTYNTYSSNISYTQSSGSLTKSAGVVYRPSGKETYYNLNMSGVVNIMRDMGNEDEYWVRDDGVKMLGDYVMVAADFNTRPRGSLVETSLGTGIVCDTGTFTYSDPTQIDVATAW